MYKPRQYGIYQIENSITGKRYIGLTTADFGKRWSTHISTLMRGKHHCKSLQREWKEYGPTAFKFGIVEICKDADAAYDRELHLIDHAQDELHNTLKAIVGRCPKCDRPIDNAAEYGAVRRWQACKACRPHRKCDDRVVVGPMNRVCPKCARALSAAQYGAARRWGYCSACKGVA